MNKELNRIRVVLSELKIKNKWMSDKMGKNPKIISLLCNNDRQLSLETMVVIAKVLDIDVCKLINPTKLI